MPLSVLEAMACNLPVVTTRFSGLVDEFDEGNGLRFIEPDEAILPVVEEMLRNQRNVGTRKMVQKYSWHSIAKKLEEYYQEIWNRT